MFTTIATCSPFLDGFGFRAELQTDGRRYKLVSWDCTIPGETVYHPPSGPYGEPVVRAECLCDDLRPGASVHDDAGIAELLCAFWEAYTSRPEEFERDPEETEQVNRDWWARWGDHLTGTDDDGSPLSWTLP